MAYLIHTFVNWLGFLYFLSDFWVIAVPIQVWLAFNFFTSTWVKFSGIMRLDMVKDELGPKTLGISKYEAYKFAVDDVVFRIQFAPFMFHEHPIPRNRHDWLMTGTLHRIKSTNPVDSWRYLRADYMCSTMLDKTDSNGEHC